jgi:hypothetical protein
MTLRLLPSLAVFLGPFAVFAQDAPAPAAPAAAEKRTLIFHRPETKGAKYDFTSKASQTRTVDYHVDDDVQPGGNESIEVTITGTLEITDVTPKAGSIAGFSLTIKKMTLTDGSGADDGLEPGTVVTGKAEKMKTTFYAHGGEVTGGLAEALSLAIPAFTGVDEPLDESFAAKGPVAPGEKWEPEIEKFAEVLKVMDGFELDAGKSSVKVRYKGPGTTAGVETDVIVASQSFVFTKIPGLPDDAKLQSAKSNYDTTFSITRDGKTTGTPDERVVNEVETRYTTKHEGKDYEVNYKIHNERHMTMKPAR